jgi:hypothetical protein
VNNSAVAVINGVRDRLRVLLVSGEPHAGERTWRNILKSDPAVDLVHFTILRPPEKQDGTPINELSLIAFPIRELFEVKLKEFDLIIFDRYRRRGVLPRAYFENIAHYVEDGGALLDAAGVSMGGPLGLYQSPLGDVLPGEPTGEVIEKGYRPAVTAIGLRHPVTADLPGGGEKPTWGRWFRLVRATVKTGNTVMSGPDNEPLLILNRYGKGRVAQLLSDQIWLWSRGYEGGGPQAELLRRVAHWLMKEPELEEEDLRSIVIDGRLEITRRSLGENPKTVDVTTPSGTKATVPLTDAGNGKATGAMAAPESGLYRVSDGAHRAFAASGDLNPIELTDLRSTGDRLRPIVEATNGGIDRLASDGLPDIRRVKPGRRRTKTTSWPAWTRRRCCLPWSSSCSASARRCWPGAAKGADLGPGPRSALAGGLGRLPGGAPAAGVVGRGIHGLVVFRPLRRQFDDIAIGIAEIYRIDEAVVGNAARLDARGLALGEHGAKNLRRDFERDVQVEIVLLLEFERAVGRLEEGEVGAVVELVERVQGMGRPAALVSLISKVWASGRREFLVEPPGRLESRRDRRCGAGP